MTIFVSPSFTWAPTTPTAGEAVQFTDTSIATLPITNWAWDFGDGGTSVLQNPTHTYATTGNYTVQLTVTASITGSTTNVVTVADFDFNCECDETTDNETLAQLRRRMLVRLGYAAQADSPPPGMADLLSDFLVQAQRLLYRRFKALRTTRMFTWTMVPGQRFYDLPDNDDACTKELDPYEIEWCGFSDLNGIWLQLIEGIPPEFYTAVRFQGYPSRYEVKQCIEIFPAPAAAYKLRIKGKFGLTSFTADADPTTINSELVFLWALGNAKAHYGQPDAEGIVAQAKQYLHDLTAGAHLTARYVPGTSPSQPWTQPKFLPISGS